MLNPSKKGLVSYVNTVDVRGHKRVNLFSAACAIAYGKDYEAEFFSKDMKSAIQLRNQLFFKKAEMVCPFEDAIYEVLVNYFQQSYLARQAFEDLDDLSCSDENFEKALRRIREQQFETVPEISASLTEEVGDVSEPEPVEEVAIKEQSSEDIVTAEDVTSSIGEEVVEEAEETYEPIGIDAQITENTPIAEEEKEISSPLVTELLQEAREATAPAKDATELDYILLFKGNISVEVNNFKLLPNSNTATELLSKIQGLLPGMAVVDIVYNKAILHALLIEFKGAASMLSSFRVLALGLSTRK